MSEDEAVKAGGVGRGEEVARLVLGEEVSKGVACYVDEGGKPDVGAGGVLG